MVAKPPAAPTQPPAATARPNARGQGAHDHGPRLATTAGASLHRASHARTQSPQGAQPALQGAQPAPEPTATARATPAPTAATVTTAAASGNAIRGQVFVDTDANGVRSDGEPGVAQVDITLTYANGLTRTARTADDGTFSFAAWPPTRTASR